MNKLIIQIPKLPTFKRESPQIVKVLDKIRFELDEKGEKYFEFYWFAREYPRFYRYHVDNIEFRLKTIHNLYQLHEKDFLKRESSNNFNDCFEMATSNQYSFQIYWEFEALLGATNSALDLIARISGIAYEQQTPVSFNKISSTKELSGLVDSFRQAKTDWVNEMKDYRDCFVHYTPVDNRVYVTLYKSTKNWKMWCKIPTNPNIREADGFHFSKKRDLLQYSNKVYKNLMKLDKEIGKQISDLYKVGDFPKRINNLFYIGQRTRK